MTDVHQRARDRRADLLVTLLAMAWGLAAVGFGIWQQLPMAIGVGAAITVVGGLGFVLGPLVAGFGAAFVTGAGAVAAGATMTDAAIAAAGMITIVLVLVLLPIAASLSRGGRGVAAGTASAVGGDMAAAEMEIVQLLRAIRDHAGLSDQARRVLFREQETELLRQAVEADIAEGKYDVALRIARQMAEVFGEVEQSESFRQRILESRHQHYEQNATQAMAELRALLASRNFVAAHQAAERIRRLFAESPQVAEIDRLMADARAEHKASLEREFLELAAKEDAEAAMGVLRVLDRYLTADEAARLREVAQGVVVRHRENLGVRFKLAVSDHQWAEAARIGEEIIAEFPNAKMAEEVRSMIGVLRDRAARAVGTGAAG